MKTPTKFQTLIKNSYTPLALSFLKYLAIILTDLNLILAIFLLNEPGSIIDFVLASLLLFSGVALVFPALRIGFMTLCFTFMCIKGVVLWFFQIPKEVKQMSSFQRYILLLATILLAVILIAITK